MFSSWPRVQALASLRTAALFRYLLVANSTCAVQKGAESVAGEVNLREKLGMMDVIIRHIKEGSLTDSAFRNHSLSKMETLFQNIFNKYSQFRIWRFLLWPKQENLDMYS